MRTLTAIAFAAALAAAGTAHAAPPLEAYGKLPTIEASQFKLSPSGQRIAFVAGTDQPGVRQLVVRELSGATLTTANLQGKVWGLEWAGDDYVLIQTSATLNSLDSARTAYGEYSQVVVLNLKTKASFAVFQRRPKVFPAVFGNFGVGQIGGRWYGYFSGLTLAGGGSGFVDFAGQAGGNMAFQPDHDWLDLYKVDLETGAPSKVVGGSPKTETWALTPGGEVTAHSEYVKETGAWGLYAGTDNSRKLLEAVSPLHEVRLSGASWRPGYAIIHDSSVDGIGAQEVDLATGKTAPLGGRSGAVIQGYVYTGADMPVGVVYEGDRPETEFFDPAVQALWAKAKKPFKDLTVSFVSADQSWKRWILFTEGDGDSGTYYLVDLNAGSAEIVATAYPAVDVADVAPSKAVTYKAADGMALSGVLTLPPGKDPKNLPLVVLPHGGPKARDHLSFDWLAQAFASRGYAVFQPNFRGSDGFGAEYRAAGDGEWGRKMQTDISDGVAELARQGVVDRKRMCIVGASYGGYAALAGVTLQNGLYRCAVSYAGLSDMTLIMREANDGSNVYTRRWRVQMGAKSAGDPIVRQVSPAAQAARADAPILLIQGTNDAVVEVAHERLMADALRAAKKPVEVVEIEGADHWLTGEAHRQQMLKAAVAFVEKHNPAN